MKKATKKALEINLGLQPVGYYVMVRLQEVKTESAGGIVIPQMVQEAEAMNLSVGQVVGMGAMAFRDRTTGEFLAQQEAWCAVGDWVICPKFGTKRVSVDEINYSILLDDEIMATIDDPKRLKGYV